jgi:hypothetical protein
MSLAWMIYFEHGPDSLQPLVDALTRHKLAVQASSPKVVQVSDGHATVQVAYNDAAFVAEEAREMLAQAPHPDAQQIARCSRRIELTWSEEDAFEATNLLGFIEPAARKVTAQCWVFDATQDGAWL